MYDTSHSLTPSGSRFSDISANLNVFPSTYASVGSMTDFNPNTRQFAGETVFLALRPPWVQPQPVQQQRLGRAYTAVPTSRSTTPSSARASRFSKSADGLTTSFLIGLGLYYEPSYDVADTKLLYSEYGLRLKSKCDCWIFDIGVNDSINPSEVQIFVQLTWAAWVRSGAIPSDATSCSTIPTVRTAGPWD